MSRDPVVSSSIASIGYSAVHGVMEVEYVTGGIYEYVGVSAEEHQEVMAAPSKGEHINRNIRGRFPFRKVVGRES